MKASKNITPPMQTILARDEAERKRRKAERRARLNAERVDKKQ